MTYYKKVVGDRCYLSPIQVEDADKWAEWLNDLDVSLPLGDEAYTSLPLDRLREYASQVIRHDEHVFTIVDLETDRPLGRCLLFNVDLVNRNAMMGLLIGEKAYWGQGYGQDATRLLLDYAFTLLNLHSVMLGVFSFNERAVHTYRAVGFREIGRRRQARIIGSQMYDLILMDILADEFAAGRVARPATPG